MNHYERIVSYIHQYQGGIKGANVGYAKIEKRGEECRIQVQLRNGHLSKEPQIYLFRQMEGGIRAVSIGTMSLGGNEIYYKGNTEVGKLFGSELSLDDVDGLLIYLSRDYYFATSWKNDSIHLGNWPLEGEGREAAVSEKSVDGVEREGAEVSDEEEPSRGEDIPQGNRTENVQENQVRNVQKNQVQNVQESQVQNAQKGQVKNVQKGQVHNAQESTADDREEIKNETREGWQNAAEISGEKGGNDREEISGARGENVVEERKGMTDRTEEEKGLEAAEAAQVQMQAICGVCPFKRQNMDYGKRILLSFPTMRPFPEEKGSECVRLELQDIGCLPMKYWSLSGNRFLLHGYYCYRHLIFCHRGQGKYVLGVPGVYSDREQKNAFRFGFHSFQSIGEFGKQQGAFGYWLMELM